MTTPLDRLTGGAITIDQQWAARLAICRYVRGDEIGPRWRKGSNSWRPEGLDAKHYAPCPHCGGNGADLLGQDGREYCPACRAEWAVGDYDWTVLSDIVRYQADRLAGLIEE